MELKYIVNNNKYQNIKEVIKSNFHISDRLLLKLKRNNKIFLNNAESNIYTPIQMGDTIIIDLNFNETSENIVPIKMNLEIIFEDETMLILNKTSNMPVHPSASHFDDSLSNGVQHYFLENNINTKIRPVNRLDKDTSRNCYFCKK